MDSILKADIFFFVTAIAVVVLSGLGTIVLIYLIRIVRDVAEITRIARREADHLRDDIEDIREDVREGVADVKAYASTLTHTLRAGSFLELLMQIISSARSKRTGTRGKRKKKRTDDDA